MNIFFLGSSSGLGISGDEKNLNENDDENSNSIEVTSSGEDNEEEESEREDSEDNENLKEKKQQDLMGIDISGDDDEEENEEVSDTGNEAEDSNTNNNNNKKDNNNSANNKNNTNKSNNKIKNNNNNNKKINLSKVTSGTQLDTTTTTGAGEDNFIVDSNSGENPSNQHNQANPNYPYSPTNSYPYIMPVPYQKQKQQHQQQLQQRYSSPLPHDNNQTKVFANLANQNTQKQFSAYQNTVRQPSANQNTQNMRRPFSTNQNTLKQFSANQNTVRQSANQNTASYNARYTPKALNQIKRNKRSLIDSGSTHSSIDKSVLFSNPFWDIHTDHNTLQTRSEIVRPKGYHHTLKNMINKRWLIPGQSKYTLIKLLICIISLCFQFPFFLYLYDDKQTYSYWVASLYTNC